MIAVSVYLIVIIARKHLNLLVSPQLLLNIIEVNLFEKTQIDKLVFDALLDFSGKPIDNQMIFHEINRTHVNVNIKKNIFTTIKL